jgi:hypothetical protein
MAGDRLPAVRVHPGPLFKLQKPVKERFGREFVGTFEEISQVAKEENLATLILDLAEVFRCFPHRLFPSTTDGFRDCK